MNIINLLHLVYAFLRRMEKIKKATSRLLVALLYGIYKETAIEFKKPRVLHVDSS